jgi:hypothetical protein
MLDRQPGSIAANFYYPLALVVRAVPMLSGPLVWYVSFWVDPIAKPPPPGIGFVEQVEIDILP